MKRVNTEEQKTSNETESRNSNNQEIPNETIASRLHKEPPSVSAEALKAASPRVIDKCYGSSGYGMGLERNMAVLFFAESVGYFCVQQTSSNAGDAYRYKILQPTDSKPRLEDHVNDEGYSCWFANAWFDDWIRAEFF